MRPIGEYVWDAVRSGDIAKLRKSLTERENANLRHDFSDGATVLHVAAENGHVPAVELLLDKGARINAVDFQGRTPLILAAQKGHKPVVSLLLRRGAHPKVKDYSGKTAADWAAFFGHDDVANPSFHFRDLQ
jgi:ankyrin repeat protein